MRQFAFLLLFFGILNSFSQTQPTAHSLSTAPYYLGSWSAASAAGTYPSSMVFHQFAPGDDPKINAEPSGDWLCTYNIDSRSRFLGLGNSGIGMINSGNEQDDVSRCGNSTALGGRAGAVTLALNTENMTAIELSWKVRLLENGNGYPSPREYRILAQYRVGTTGEWISFPASTVFSSINKEKGASQEFVVNLPDECENKDYVQIRWKYYQENSNDGGTRPLMAVDDIKVVGAHVSTGYKPFVFLNAGSLDVFGCVQGNFSEVDSLIVSAMSLKENLKITSSGKFYISASKAGPFQQELTLNVNNGNLEETTIYIKKECTDVAVENASIRFISGTYNRAFSVRGEGYYKLYINEVVSSNFLSYYDRFTRDYPDWIEIYNPNNVNARIWGYYLSDDITQLNKHMIASVAANTVPQNGFNLFLANGDINPSPSHLNFSISTFGETIFLVGKNGKTIIDSITVRNNEGDISYGRETDGNDNWVLFQKTTPGASNNTSTGHTGRTEKPVFSHQGGHYGEAFLLSLQVNNPDAKIYYTLDGSDPTPDNLGGFVYEYKQSYTRERNGTYIGDSYFRPYRSFFYYEPIDLSLHRTKYFWIGDINATISLNPFVPKVRRDHANIVRAVAIEPGKYPSEIVTNSYFFANNDPVKDKLPVISISLNEDRLKGFENGIGVPGTDYESWRIISSGGTNNFSPANYTRSGREAEIPANIEIFDGSSSYVNQLVGLRIHGGASRAFIHKSFRVYARNYYGLNKISYPIFKDLPYEDFSRLILRNSGADYSSTFFRDAFIQRLMRFTGMDYQEYQPFVIYINGEYWGMLNARERIDDNYFERKYGFDEGGIDFLENNRLMLSGDNIHYTELMDYLTTNDISSDVVYKEANTKMDIENYIDYQSIKIYTAEYDWPNNNIRYWRYKTTQYNPKAPYGLDGRWRWVNFDNDGGFSNERLNMNSFDWALSFYSPKANPNDEPEEWWASLLFRTMMKNEKFKLHFITRYSDLLNTAFKPERVVKEIDGFKNLIEHDIYNYINRWETLSSKDAWLSHVDALKKFGTERAGNCYNHLRSSFKLGELSTVNIDVNEMAHGHIKMNTMEITRQTPGVDTSKVYPWSGQYFRDLPVSFIAVPHEGYKFSHWELTDSTSYLDTLVFDLKKDVIAKAFFVYDENYKYIPEPAIITDCPYEFTEWSRLQRVGAMPSNMAFYSTKYADSRFNGPIENKLDSIRYDYTSRTRINGLGANGISLINTADANENYYQTRLGAVAVAFRTENVQAADVSFTLGTITPNSKKYSIRLQYRLSDRGEVFDFYDKNGKIVEYNGQTETNHEQRFEKIELPDNLLNQRYVQLIWRYYFNGQQIDLGSNTRDELRVDDILIRQKDIVDVRSDELYVSTLVGNPNSKSFQWYKCEGDSLVLLENETKQTLRITTPGTYAIAVEYGECNHTSECEYFFVKERKEFAPSIFTRIHPNPSTGVFNVIFDETLQNVKISMVNASGKVVNVKNIAEAKNISYEVKGLAAGVYILDITTKDGRQASQKVVIQ